MLSGRASTHQAVPGGGGIVARRARNLSILPDVAASGIRPLIDRAGAIAVAVAVALALRWRCRCGGGGGALAVVPWRWRGGGGALALRCRGRCRCRCGGVAVAVRWRCGAVAVAVPVPVVPVPYMSQRMLFRTTQCNRAWDNRHRKRDKPQAGPLLRRRPQACPNGCRFAPSEATESGTTSTESETSLRQAHPSASTPPGMSQRMPIRTAQSNRIWDNRHRKRDAPQAGPPLRQHPSRHVPTDADSHRPKQPKLGQAPPKLGQPPPKAGQGHEGTTKGRCERVATALSGTQIAGVRAW
jgi:hypothetical protein